jgi:hypothetical protein
MTRARNPETLACAASVAATDFAVALEGAVLVPRIAAMACCVDPLGAVDARSDKACAACATMLDATDAAADRIKLSDATRDSDATTVALAPGRVAIALADDAEAFACAASERPVSN